VLFIKQTSFIERQQAEPEVFLSELKRVS
jgi:hypothetical protein